MIYYKHVNLEESFSNSLPQMNQLLADYWVCLFLSSNNNNSNSDRNSHIPLAAAECVLRRNLCRISERKYACVCVHYNSAYIGCRIHVGCIIKTAAEAGVLLLLQAAYVLNQCFTATGTRVKLIYFQEDELKQRIQENHLPKPRSQGRVKASNIKVLCLSDSNPLVCTASN